MIVKAIVLVVAIAQVTQLSASPVSIKFPDKKFNVSSIVFPKGFLLGTATASYQVEGAWNVGGKGENIWDRLVHTNPTVIKMNDTGDVACDSYHKYKEDVQNMKTIGFNVYRFSLSWSRLFPKGFVDSQPNPDGVRYYNALIDELIANGITPLVSLYHWDLPQPLQDIGGWLNPYIADVFAEYARACYKLFGDRVKWWVTINEALSVVGGYSNGPYAPNLDFHRFGKFLSGHNLLRAHGKAYRVYDKEFRQSQKGKVSFILNPSYYVPQDSNSKVDVDVATKLTDLNVDWFGHPIYSKEGDYTQMLKDDMLSKGCPEGINKETCLPEFTKEEIEEIRGSADYLALNHYTSNLVVKGVVVANSDKNVVWPKSACDWLTVYPEGFSGMLRLVRKKYENPEIVVTENGYCGSDLENDEDKRVDYYTGYLNEMVKAMNEGSKVIGYTAWSLMDNFEWFDGYTKKFGIMSVDFKDPNRPRKFKDSSALFKQIIDQNNL